MAALEAPALDVVWRALANPLRRRILDVLRDHPRQTGEIADVLAENRFVVMQHLGLLREAKLVVVENQGRARMNHMNPIPIQQIYERWVGKYQADWASALVGLKHAAERRAAAPARRTRTAS